MRITDPIPKYEFGLVCGDETDRAASWMVVETNLTKTKGVGKRRYRLFRWEASDLRGQNLLGAEFDFHEAIEAAKSAARTLVTVAISPC